MKSLKHFLVFKLTVLGILVLFSGQAFALAITRTSFEESAQPEVAQSMSTAQK